MQLWISNANGLHQLNDCSKQKDNSFYFNLSLLTEIHWFSYEKISSSLTIQSTINEYFSFNHSQAYILARQLQFWILCTSVLVAFCWFNLHWKDWNCRNMEFQMYSLLTFALNSVLWHFSATFENCSIFAIMIESPLLLILKLHPRSYILIFVLLVFLPHFSTAFTVWT